MNALAAFFFVVSLSCSTELAQQTDLPTSYKTAYRRAQDNHKPILVLVTAEWCAPCQMLKRTTLRDMMAKRGFKDFNFAMVDVDRDPEIAAKLTEGRPVPQFIVFEHQDDSWIRRYSIGYHSIDQVQAFLAPSLKAAVRVAEGQSEAQSR
jgi:thioredoxin-like negative regulator of GroEL